MVTEPKNHTVAGALIAAREPMERTGRVVLARHGRCVHRDCHPAPVAARPTADDFNNCVAPRELGLDGFMIASWRQLGAIRPARFVEILLAAGVCGSLPFGIAILVPLLLTVIVALLARGLLLDLGTPGMCANVGGTLWLRQPLVTEAGRCPAALHVPLRLAFVLQPCACTDAVDTRGACWRTLVQRCR